MSDVHVRLLTLDPVRGGFVPVRGARLELIHDGVINRTLGAVDATGADGRAVVPVGEDTGGLSPFFEIDLENAAPVLPAGAPARHLFTLPESWETLHFGDNRLQGIERHASQAQELVIYAGLPGLLDLETSDSHPTGLGNPGPLPPDTLRVHLADSDLCFDDTLTGKGFDRPGDRVADVGEELPYHDLFPTAPHVLDLPAAGAARPRAWVDPPGAPVASLGGGGFRAAGPLATDRNGFVFLADGDRIHRFYPDGTWCETLTLPPEAGVGFLPAGLAVDSEWNLYAADPARDRIEVFRLDSGLGASGHYRHLLSVGGILATGDPLGTGDSRDRLARPAHLAVVRSARPDGRELLVVANEGSGRCLVFTLDPGRAPLLASGFGAAAAEPATPEQIREPGGVAADRHGRVFVSDRALGRITVWRIDREAVTPAAAHRATWAADGGGAFNAPGALAFGLADGRLYVAEAGRVRRLDPGGPDEAPAAPARDALWDAGELPDLDGGAALDRLDLAADERGELYLADRANRRVVRLSLFDGAGAPIPAAGPPRAVTQWRAGGGDALQDPAYVFLSAAGRLWVSDTGNDRLVGYDRDPVSGQLFRAAAFSSAPLRSPRGVAEDPDGNLYVASPVRGRIHRIAPGLDQETLLGGDDRPFDEPVAVAFLPGETPRLLVVDRGRNELRFQGLDGALGERIGEADGEVFDHPEDVAADASGKVYVADTGNHRVVRLDLGQTPPAARSYRLADAGLGWAEPSGVAVDPQGRLIVTDRGKGRVFRIDPADGGVLAFWDLTHLLPRSAALGSTVDGEVRYAGGLRLTGEAVAAGRLAHRVSVAGRLEIVPAGAAAGAAATESHDLTVGDWVLVADGALVDDDTLLAYRLPDAGGVHAPRRPELARQVLFDRPARALFTPHGVLAVADSGRHRVRLARVETRLPVLFLDLGRGAGERPDLSFRGLTDGDWRGDDDLGLRLSVEPEEPGDPLELPADVQREIEDFVGDLYETRHRLSPRSRLNEAVHVMAVARQVQRWMIHLTRTDDPERRWGRGPGADRRVRVNLMTRSRKTYFQSANNQLSLGVDRRGAGADSWDPGVIAHELAHWVQHHSIGFDFPYNLANEQGHFLDQVLNQNVALIEGFADYVALFWGSEHATTDRVRGATVASLHEVTADPHAATPSFRSLYQDPRDGLQVEGYVANALWQIHHAAVEPEVRFADSPSFWHHHHQALPEARSRLFVELFRRTLREVPAEADQMRGSEFWLRRILERAHVLSEAGTTWLPRTVQAIYELNNLLVPVVSVDPASIQVRPGETAALTARLLDATGRPLAGHALRFEISAAAAGTGRYRFPGAAPAAPPGGVRGRAGAEPAILVRATGPDGRVRLEVAPAADLGNLDEEVRVSYQPDFHTDPVLAPPEPGGDLETLTRQLYLHHLRESAVERHGAAVTPAPVRVGIRS